MGEDFLVKPPQAEQHEPRKDYTKVLNKFVSNRDAAKASLKIWQEHAANVDAIEEWQKKFDEFDKVVKGLEKGEIDAAIAYATKGLIKTCWEEVRAVRGRHNRLPVAIPISYLEDNLRLLAELSNCDPFTVDELARHAERPVSPSM